MALAKTLIPTRVCVATGISHHIIEYNIYVDRFIVGFFFYFMLAG